MQRQFDLWKDQGRIIKPPEDDAHGNEYKNNTLGFWFLLLPQTQRWHVLPEVSWGPHTWARCSCGPWFALTVAFTSLRHPSCFFPSISQETATFLGDMGWVLFIGGAGPEGKGVAWRNAQGACAEGRQAGSQEGAGADLPGKLRQRVTKPSKITCLIKAGTTFRVLWPLSRTCSVCVWLQHSFKHW